MNDEDSINQWDDRIRGTLSRAWGDHGWVPVHDETPLDELMNADPEWDAEADGPAGEWAWPSSEQPDVILNHLKKEEARQIADWAWRSMARWIAGDGIHPFRIVQRFYALARKFYPVLIGPLSGADLAEMLGQGRAAFQATMRRLFDDPARLLLGQAVKVAGQKPESARKAFQENAAKHCPRRMLNGHDGAGLSEGERKGRRAGLNGDQKRKLQEARAAAEKRELARDAEEFRRRIEDRGARSEGAGRPENLEGRKLEFGKGERV